MPYGFKVTYNGADITAKVESFEVSASTSEYCRTLTLDLADHSYFSLFDLTTALPTTPQLEVFTKIAGTFISQGKFFIERPMLSLEQNSSMIRGLWGRSISAKLGLPFAPKVNKTWTTQKLFSEICQEMHDLVGLTWDSNSLESGDFAIFANTYQAEGLTPIEIISGIAELAGAYVTCKRTGEIRILQREFSPSAYAFTITDPLAQSIEESPEWPDFGNRIKITSTGATGSGYSVDAFVKQKCLAAGASTKVFARVTDTEGLGVNDITVNWDLDEDLGTLAAAASNTQTVVIQDEQQKGKTFYKIATEFPPEAVLGIYAITDANRSENFATGATINDDNEIVLATSLLYCDQTVLVTYQVKGIAVNTYTAGSVTGVDSVEADVSGNMDSEEIYVENPCYCTPTLTLVAAPTTISLGAESSLLAYYEENGEAVTSGKLVYMTEKSNPKRGVLDWSQAHLANNVKVLNDQASVINEIPGLCQCEMGMFIASVTQVRLKGEDTDGNPIGTGSNLYASFSGKTITLNTSLDTGTELLVDYHVIGAVVNAFEGAVEGTARIVATMYTAREEPLEADCTITVETDKPDGTTACDPAYDADGQKITVDLTQGDNFLAGENIVTTPVNTAFGVIKSTGSESGKIFVVVVLGAGSITFKSGDIVVSAATGAVGTVTEASGSGGNTGVVECKPNEECCEHITTGETGCWPSEQCAADDPTDDPDGDPDGGHDKGKKDEPKSDPVKPSQPRGSCAPANCTNNLTEECLAGRFANPISLGCTCEQVCRAEMDVYGTTQAYDGSSMRTISRIVIEDDALEYNSPEYWEKIEERETEALGQCQDDCGDCTTADPVVVSGSDAVTSNGSYQYTASGGIGPYTWSVSGEGATVDQTGLVTLSGSACGAFAVTATDTCGISDVVNARVTDNGMWGPATIICEPSNAWECSTWGGADCIVGSTFHDITCAWWVEEGSCDNCRDVSTPCTPCSGLMQRYATQEWICP